MAKYFSWLNTFSSFHVISVTTCTNEVRKNNFSELLSIHEAMIASPVDISAFRLLSGSTMFHSDFDQMIRITVKYGTDTKYSPVAST